MCLRSCIYAHADSQSRKQVVIRVEARTNCTRARTASWHENTRARTHMGTHKRIRTCSGKQTRGHMHAPDTRTHRHAPTHTHTYISIDICIYMSGHAPTHAQIVNARTCTRRTSARGHARASTTTPTFLAHEADSVRVETDAAAKVE